MKQTRYTAMINNLRRNRRRRRANRFASGGFSYPFSTKPTSLGVGFASNLVTKTGTLPTGNGLATFETGLAQNVEFMTMVQRFQYFKLTSVAVIFYSTNVTGDGKIFFLMDWDGSNINMATDLDIKNDNVKVVPGYLTRNKVFRFIPPNMNISCLVAGLDRVVNWTTWLSSDHYFRNTVSSNFLPGSIYFNNSTSSARSYRIEFRVVYRGIRPFELNDMTKMLQEIAVLQEKEKEQEKMALEKAKIEKEHKEYEEQFHKALMKKQIEKVLSSEAISEEEEVKNP